jgi:exopolyphosphatase/guanosine-5'-triphosphate,3'-diphosphate pyrophosphatase
LKIHLVRHASAVPRSDWKGNDLLRPLSDWGQEEAEAIAEQLLDEPITRIVAGPTLRCQQTVEPLAVARDLTVEVDERLGRDEDIERMLELMPASEDGAVLFCSHSELIIPMLHTFELGDPEDGSRLECKKGSIWVLDGPGAVPSRATYFEPERRPKRRRRVRYSEREVARPRSVRVGVLDMGSTSFTLLIADARRDGEIRPVVSEKVMLRLGATVAADGMLPDAVFEDALDVARALHAVARQEKVERFAAVGTAALRDAANGSALASAVGEAIGEPVQVLSGQDEARATFRAFQRRLALGDEPVVGIDLGGGSLELALGSNLGVTTALTLPAGVVRLDAELVRHDPMSRGDVRRLRDRVCELVKPHRRALLRSGATRAIAAGGTVRALARLVVERRSKRSAGSLNSVDLSLEALRDLADELVHASHDQRLRLRGMRRRRADLLPAGAVILQALIEELGMESLRVCDWGLREGVLLGSLEP